MKRNIINFIVVLLFTVLIHNYFVRNLFGIGYYMILPDLILIFVILTGIFCGTFASMITGFFAGLLLDFMSYRLVGFYGLTYCIIGYMITFLEENVSLDNILSFIVLIVLSIIIKSLIYLVLAFNFLSKSDIIVYFRSFFLFQTLYTVLISIVIFYIYRRVFISFTRRKVQDE